MLDKINIYITGLTGEIEVIKGINWSVGGDYSGLLIDSLITFRDKGVDALAIESVLFDSSLPVSSFPVEAKNLIFMYRSDIEDYDWVNPVQAKENNPDAEAIIERVRAIHLIC